MENELQSSEQQDKMKYQLYEESKRLIRTITDGVINTSLNTGNYDLIFIGQDPDNHNCSGIAILLSSSVADERLSFHLGVIEIDDTIFSEGGESVNKLVLDLLTSMQEPKTNRDFGCVINYCPSNSLRGELILNNEGDMGKQLGLVAAAQRLIVSGGVFALYHHFQESIEFPDHPVNNVYGRVPAEWRRHGIKPPAR